MISRATIAIAGAALRSSACLADFTLRTDSTVTTVRCHPVYGCTITRARSALATRRESFTCPRTWSATPPTRGAATAPRASISSRAPRRPSRPADDTDRLDR
jgi:hypothetical protein